MAKKKGLGDTIEKITEVTGIKAVVKAVVGDDCGCEERKHRLNKLFSYKVGRCLTEEERAAWGEFQAVRTLTITDEQIKFICSLYASAYDVPYYEPCRNCSPKPLLSMIDKIDRLFE
jgi:hypothetical protein